MNYKLPKKLEESTCPLCHRRDEWYVRILDRKHKVLIEQTSEVAFLWKVIKKLFGRECLSQAKKLHQLYNQK